MTVADPIVKRQRWRRLRHGLLLSLALLSTLAAGLGLLLGGGLVWLDTGPGQRWLVGRLNAMLAEDGIVLGELDGSIYSDLSLNSLRLLDEKGVWLEASNIAVQWRPRALLNRNAALDHLRIGTLALTRLPADDSRTTEPDASWLSLPSLPDLPVALSLDSLDAPRIDIAAAAFGQAATLALEAREIRYAQGVAALSLQVERRDSDADSISIDLVFDRPAGRLDLMADITGAPGGLLARIAGASEGDSVALTLTGDGPLNDWTGRLKASRGKGLSLDAGLRHANATLRIAGALKQTGLLPPDMQRVLGRRANIRLSADLARRPVLPLDIAVTTDAGGVEITGDATTGDDDVALDFAWQIASSGTLSLPSREITLEAFDASGRLGGTLSAPTFTAGAGLRDAILPGDVKLKQLRLQANGRWSGQTLKMHASLDVGGLVVTGLAPVDAGLDVTGRYGAQDDMITLSDWQLVSDGMTLTGSGRYGLASGAMAVRARVESLDLGALPVALPLHGRLNGELGLGKPDSAAPLAMTVELGGRDIGGLDPALDDLIGADPRLTAAMQLDGDGLRLNSAALTGTHAVLETSGSIDLDGPDLALDYQLTLRDLAQVYPATAAQQGDIAITGRIEGGPENLRATAESRIGAVTMQGVTLRDLALSVEGDDLATLPQLTLTVTALSDLGPLDAKLEAAMDKDRAIVMPALAVSLGRLNASGNVRIRPGGPAVGRITGRIEEAEEKETRTPIAGMGDFTIGFDEDNGQQTLQIAASGQDLRINPVRGAVTTVESLSLEGDLRFGDALPTGKLRLEIVNADHGFSRLSRLGLAARAADSGAVIEAVAKGDWRGPLDLEATLDAEGLDSQPALTLTAAGRLFGLPVETVSPPRLQQTPGGWALSDMELRLGEGRLAAEAQIGAQDSAIHIDAEGLPLELFSAALPALSPSGRFGLTADIRQVAGDVTGSSTITVSGFRPLTPGLMDAPAMDLGLDADLAGDRLALSGNVSGQAGLVASLSADMPLVIDLAAARMEMPADAEFRAALDWQGEIAPIVMALDLPTHEAQGRVNASLRLTGTLSDPHLDGDLKLADGRYEHLDSGFLADDLTMELSFADARIALEELTATDGGRGRLSASGHALWRDGAMEAAEFTLGLEQVVLIRRSDASATVSADIDYRLQDGEGIVSGRIAPERVEISIARDLPDDIQTLDVVELTPRETDAPRQRDAMRLRNLPTKLDLTVEANNRLFVRGRGLDSEWRSDLRITGTTDSPRILGAARLVKGVFDFAGRRFTLDEGELLFAGGTRIDPDLRIVASETVNGTDFRITVTGRASSPQVALSSTPALPEDEILARLLFGESVGNLSALEAVQLASALSSLSGGGGNFDLVGKLRGTLGLDRLSVDLGGETGGATLSGGKYLTDDVYFEVAAETVTGETKGIVSWDLTRNLNLRGTVASSRDSAISLRWRWSY